MEGYNGYIERKEAILVNAEKNSPGICRDTRLNRKLHLFASCISSLEFTDCLAQYDRDTESWLVHIWLGKKNEVVFLFDDGNDFDMMVYIDGQYILGETFGDAEMMRVVSSWKKIIEKTENHEENEEKRSFWHGFCNRLRKIKEKIWRM